MLRELEYQTLLQINFVERYAVLLSQFVKEPLSGFKINKKQFTAALAKTSYDFENSNQMHLTTKVQQGVKFRLLLDRHGDSILAYIYIMDGEDFINNGLSHLGYLLNYFSLEGYSFNQQFGINSTEELEAYINGLISIFEDFIDRYLNLINSQTSGEADYLITYREKVS